MEILIEDSKQIFLKKKNSAEEYCTYIPSHEIFSIFMNFLHIFIFILHFLGWYKVSIHRCLCAMIYRCIKIQHINYNGMFENHCKYSKAYLPTCSPFSFLKSIPIGIRITERSLKFELARSTVDYVWLWNSPHATVYICQFNIIIIILDTYLQYSNSNLIADACSFTVHCAWLSSLNSGMWRQTLYNRLPTCKSSNANVVGTYL